MQEMLTPSGRRCSRGSWKSAPLLCVLSSPLEPPRSFSHRLTLFAEKKNVCCTSCLLRTSPPSPQQYHCVNLTQFSSVLTMQLFLTV